MGGGPVATALCVLARLGHSCLLVDVCGDDAMGEMIRQGLEQEGVSTAGLQVIPGARSAEAVVLVRARDGARQIIYRPSTAGEPVMDAAAAARIEKAALLHLNGRHETAACQAVAIAQKQGVTISFDGGAGRWRESLRDLVQASHLRILALDFARRYCQTDDLDEMLRQLLEPPARLVVITDGLRGSEVALPDGCRFHQPAFPVELVVDTTGCGDVFHGAFLHGWLSGWPVADSARFASQLAAQNATGLGGRHVCDRLAKRP